MERTDSFISHLLCTNCKTECNSDELQTVCRKCGKVLFPIYNLEKAKEVLSKTNIASRHIFSIWRLKEIMPVKNPHYRFTLGEGWTPILPLRNYGKELGLNSLFIKDEGKNPTGTFKSRGLCAAVSKGIELGVKHFTIPSAGNAGAALSAYTSLTGTKAHVYIPQDTPMFIIKEIERMGGELTTVPGLITDAGYLARIAAEEYNYFDVSTMKEPYRVEGKKTMGYELAEQFNWELPDHIIYPTGGGTGIVGMWKAFGELETLGLIDEMRPKMISIQSSGCAPIVKAFESGATFASPWKETNTFASGLRVPSAIGDYLILKVIRESNGIAISIDDLDIKRAMYSLARKEGIMLCPEAAAAVGAIKELNISGFVKSDEKILILGTGSGLTTPTEW